MEMVNKFFCSCRAVLDIPFPDIMEAICDRRSSSFNCDNVDIVRPSCSCLVR